MAMNDLSCLEMADFMTLEVNKEVKARWKRVRNAVKMTAMHRRLARMGEARKQALEPSV